MVLDLETTGLSRTTNNIIEVAAEVLSHEGIPVEDGVYSSLIRPPSPIPTFITELTGITQEMVEDKEDFATTIKEFFKFIEDRRHAIEETTSSPANHVVFVGHNAVRFDFPFLLNELKRNNLLSLLQSPAYGYAVDTLVLAKIAVRTQNLAIPSSYKLSSLYEYITNDTLGDSAHRALADVKATSAIFRHRPFWSVRKNHLVYFLAATTQEEAPDDSNIDMDNDDGTDEDGSQNDSLPTTIERTCWQMNKDFKGFDSESKFVAEFQRRNTRATSGIRTGLQCSESSVNSPSKAWRQVFTNAILDKIMVYTNEYGEENCKDWVTVSRQDITDFFSILFISKSMLCLRLFWFIFLLFRRLCS